MRIRGIEPRVLCERRRCTSHLVCFGPHTQTEAIFINLGGSSSLNHADLVLLASGAGGCCEFSSAVRSSFFFIFFILPLPTVSLIFCSFIFFPFLFPFFMVIII
ncbi:hypothetical protein VNO78_18031 [Psophocarpus tetragonolobus]|uniref:Uncharacterized protein n=1 Tax=Psophocarpus tetragonolobus TaxID=3891 RepID=A0AAN9XLM4_PSOTE